MRLAGGASVVVLLLLAVATSPWASDGWYLLIPPLSEYDDRAAFMSGYRILDNKPLSEWRQQGAYDSAKECETVRNSLLAAEQTVFSRSSESYAKASAGGMDPVVLKIQQRLTEGHNADVWALMASRCIQSNDPRLAR
jgi:hypothetical protein